MTGKATTVQLAPMTLEAMLRSPRRVYSGFLRGALVNAALKLWPDFVPTERRKLSAHPLIPKEPEAEPWQPAWRRRRDDQQAQGLVEYGLALVLIAIVAIAALLVIGDVVAGMLSDVGASI